MIFHEKFRQFCIGIITQQWFQTVHLEARWIFAPLSSPVFSWPESLIFPLAELVLHPVCKDVLGGIWMLRNEFGFGPSFVGRMEFFEIVYSMPITGTDLT